MGRRGYSHSGMMEKRLQKLLSGLPPINFSLQPRHLERGHPWPEIHRGDSTAVTKSWQPAPLQCGAAYRRPQLCHVSKGPPKMPNRYPHNHFLGDSSVTEEMPNASYWRLLKPATLTRPDPPPTIPSPMFKVLGPKTQLNRVHLAPNSPSSGLMVKHTVIRDISPYVSSYREISIRHESITVDPFDSKKKLMEFTSLVHCKGKFYAITLQGAVAVMQVNDTRLQITAVGSSRAVPRSRSRFFTEYLFEMMEEILLIFLIHYESIEVVDDMEVFRLDSDRLDWVKVERLRGKTLFLKELSCDWVESAVFGCRDDCVFFTEGKENKWRVYDLKTRCISFV